MGKRSKVSRIIRGLGCLFLVFPPGCLFLQVALQVPLGNKSVNRQIDLLQEALIGDAEGENRLHAWVVEMSRLEHAPHDWRLRRSKIRYYYSKGQQADPPPDPFPLPEVFQHLVDWTFGEVTLQVRESMERKVVLHFNGEYRTVISLVFSEEYFNNPPPDAEALRAAIPVKPLDRREYSRHVVIVPGFELSYGVYPR